MDDFSTAEIVVLVIVFLNKGIIAPMSCFWLGFGLGFFVSDGGGREVSTLHSLGPPAKKMTRQSSLGRSSPLFSPPWGQ